MASNYEAVPVEDDLEVVTPASISPPTTPVRSSCVRSLAIISLLMATGMVLGSAVVYAAVELGWLENIKFSGQNVQNLLASAPLTALPQPAAPTVVDDTAVAKAPIAPELTTPVPTPSKQPDPHEGVIPIWYDNQLWWDGTYDTYPKPLPATASTPLPTARGKRAFVTMITGYGKGFDRYTCLGLALVTSIMATKPDPTIDIVIAILIDDGDVRYHKQPKPAPGEVVPNLTPQAVLGDEVYNTLITAGVDGFVIWREMPTEGKHMVGGWKQAWSKLQVWTLVNYEKVVFLDSDTLVFKNIDHLFSYPEFTSGATWDCHNANAPLKPSGGFWVLQPSMYTWGLILEYSKGRDPCAHTWRMGDMTMTRVLFMDLKVLMDPDSRRRQTFDGDFEHWGRCREAHLWPSRIDFLDQHVSYSLPTGDLSPLDRWVMLNESYDVLVGPCNDETFYQGGKIETDDRYNHERGNGATTWGRPDVFSVHFSCGMKKPSCEREPLDDLAPCERAMFEKWYEFLHVHYKPKAT